MISNALFWLSKYHVDGLRVDVVASMLYLDFSAAARANGSRIQHGGRENLEAIAFCRTSTTVVHHVFPDAETIAEESDLMADECQRPPCSEGSGFDVQMGHGLDARHPTSWSMTRLIVPITTTG